MWLKQSTVKTVLFGAFVDETDGRTAETALTIAQADMQLSKAGAAFALKNAAGNATHDTDGWYNTSLNATDTATVGELILQVNVAGALPVQRRWWVLEEAIFDALMDTSANAFALTTGGVNVTRIVSNSAAATGLSLSAQRIVSGQAATGTLSVTQMTSNLSEATDNHYNGRTIIWTTGDLVNQATNITDYTGTGGLLTFTEVTEIPADGDNFIIV